MTDEDYLQKIDHYADLLKSAARDTVREGLSRSLVNVYISCLYRVQSEYDMCRRTGAYRNRGTSPYSGSQNESREGVKTHRQDA